MSSNSLRKASGSGGSADSRACCPSGGRATFVHRPLGELQIHLGPVALATYQESQDGREHQECNQHTDRRDDPIRPELSLAASVQEQLFCLGGFFPGCSAHLRASARSLPFSRRPSGLPSLSHCAPRRSTLVRCSASQSSLFRTMGSTRRSWESSYQVLPPRGSARTR